MTYDGVYKQPWNIGMDDDIGEAGELTAYLKKNKPRGYRQPCWYSVLSNWLISVHDTQKKKIKSEFFTSSLHNLVIIIAIYFSLVQHDEKLDIKAITWMNCMLH